MVLKHLLRLQQFWYTLRWIVYVLVTTLEGNFQLIDILLRDSTITRRYFVTSLELMTSSGMLFHRFVKNDWLFNLKAEVCNCFNCIAKPMAKNKYVSILVIILRFMRRWALCIEKHLRCWAQELLFYTRRCRPLQEWLYLLSSQKIVVLQKE